MDDKFYLRQDVLVEPLFNQWYAWLGLISPATAALYIANSHLKIMQSFVNSPDFHVFALKNPKMMGGPFINYDASFVGDIKALIKKTAEEQAHMLELAEGIKALDDMLEKEADGYSLEPLYDRVPDQLRGLVELVYDLKNNPSMRLLEGLVYRSHYYNESSQSLCLSVIDGDDRPFVFSTPRLENEAQFHLNTPFASQGLDLLSRMKWEAAPLPAVKEALGVNCKNGRLFSSFFTQEPPPLSPPYDGDSVRIRYFGHASVLVESKGIAVLTDPVISYGHGKGVSRYTFADLPDEIDYVLITHNHQDHCMLETLLQLRHRTKNLIVPKNNGGSVADPSMKMALQRIGFSNVTEIDDMEVIKIEGGRIIGLPFIGEHADLNIRSKIAYMVELSGRSVVCAADSNNLEPRMYRLVHEFTRDVDVLFLGMECDGAPLSWIYGPLLTKTPARKLDQSRRLNGSDYMKGMSIIDELNPKQVYVYAMGQEPWMTFVTAIQYTPESRPMTESDRLVQECGRRGIQSERLFAKKEILLPAN